MVYCRCYLDRYCSGLFRYVLYIPRCVMVTTTLRSQRCHGDHHPGDAMMTTTLGPQMCHEVKPVCYHQTGFVVLIRNRFVPPKSRVPLLLFVPS